MIIPSLTLNLFLALLCLKASAQEAPSHIPSLFPSLPEATEKPSASPTDEPSTTPTCAPSLMPSGMMTYTVSNSPSMIPSTAAEANRTYRKTKHLRHGKNDSDSDDLRCDQRSLKGKSSSSSKSATGNSSISSKSSKSSKSGKTGKSGKGSTSSFAVPASENKTSAADNESTSFPESSAGVSVMAVVAIANVALLAAVARSLRNKTLRNVATSSTQKEINMTTEQEEEQEQDRLSQVFYDDQTNFECIETAFAPGAK